MINKEKEIDEVLILRETKGLTFTKIADILKFSERTARRRYEEGLIKRAAEVITKTPTALEKSDTVIDIKVDSPWIPNGKVVPERFRPLERVGDCILAADFHIPLHDPDLINTLITCARTEGIKNLVVAGDFWNMDSFSSYLPHQPEAAWSVERYEGNYIMKALLKTFDEVDFIWGNHDFRVTKATGFKESFIKCMEWAFEGLSEAEMSKLRISDLDYMYYFPTTDHEEIRICHPQSFSSVPLTVPRKLAEKYGSGVLSAHSHHCSLGVAKDGLSLIGELGGLFDKRRTEYIQRTTTHHEWVQGFWLFKDGVPTPISPTFGNDLDYR